MPSSSPTQDELELISFLSSPNWQVRQVSLSNLAGFSPKNHPRRDLLLYTSADSSVDVITSLKRLTTDLPPIAHDAFSTLINLSDSAIVSRRIATEDFLALLVSYIFHPESLLADLASMLLSNLTKVDAVAKKLVEMRMDGAALGMDENTDLAALELLLAAFDQGATVVSDAATTGKAVIEEMKKRVGGGAQTGEGGTAADTTSSSSPQPSSSSASSQRKSNCHFLASVFANVTALPAGREFFTTPLSANDWSTLPAGRLFPYTEHPDLIRRGGCISSLKNILFVKSCHGAMIAPAAAAAEQPQRPADFTSSTLDILPSLLLPLCTGKLFSALDDEEQDSLPEELQFLEEDKKLEKDSALRSMLVESLLLLGTTLYGRECMRTRGVYVVVRELHKGEIDERIGESIARLVNLLKREESSATRGDREEDDDHGEGDGPEGAAASADQKAIDEIIGAESAATATTAQGGGDDDDQEEDMVVEEL